MESVLTCYDLGNLIRKDLMAQKGHVLRFACIKCHTPVQFSVLQLDERGNKVSCPNCDKQYSLTDETLNRQLHKFESLCRQILLRKKSYPVLM